MGRQRERVDPNARVIPDPQYPGCYMVKVDGTDQSYIDLDDPTHLEFDYIQRMADLIDARFPRPGRLHAAHVGGAGMTLPRWLAHTRPGSAQRVFDPDEELIDEVRAVAPLPVRSGIKVRTEDGRAGLDTLAPGRLDLVVVDAYAGGRVPPSLSTQEFFALCSSRLAPGGLFLMNLSDGNPLTYARRVAAGAGVCWPHLLLGGETSILRGRRFGNLLLAASTTELPAAEVARVWAGGPFPYRIEALDEGRRGWLGGAAPWRDDESSWSRSFVDKFLG